MFMIFPHFPGQSRLQVVPFWSVERVRSQRSETGARKNLREETSPQAPLRSFALGYFARPLDYPERDRLQSSASQKNILVNICSEGLNRQKFDLNCEEKLTFSFGVMSP